MDKLLSLHIEQYDGLNHLAWCIWEHNRYRVSSGVFLISANKVSDVDAVLPKVVDVIKAEKPHNVIYLWACPQARKIRREIGWDYCPWDSLGGSKNHILMDENLLAHGKDIVSLEGFKIPDHLLFKPDLIFNKGFEGCILQGDAVRHDDTKLLLSKACAIGAIYII